MERLTVYFLNNNKMEIDRDKAAFTRIDGSFFNLKLGDEQDGKTITYQDLVEGGSVLVNWDNVCYVKTRIVEDDEKGDT